MLEFFRVSSSWPWIYVNAVDDQFASRLGVLFKELWTILKRVVIHWCCSWLRFKYFNINATLTPKENVSYIGCKVYSLYFSFLYFRFFLVAVRCSQEFHEYSLAYINVLYKYALNLEDFTISGKLSFPAVKP